MALKYETPLPKLSVDIDALSLETRSAHSGSFYIKNIGGGSLVGRILSRCKGLSFEPREFEGNAKIEYTFNAASAGLGIGEAVSSRFFVTSNGGEKEIPITAKHIKMSVATPEGRQIANLRDFYEYAQAHPSQARRIFIDSEFYMLLLASGYEFMEVYETLHRDANRERAMDNFFILSGLKKRTELEIMGEAASPLVFSASYRANPHNVTKPSAGEKVFEYYGDTREISGEFKVKKSDDGYADAAIISENEAEWLKLSTGKLGAADFGEDRTATVSFAIDPSKIKQSSGYIFARERVHVAGQFVDIIYNSLPPLVLKLNRASYRYADKGVIEVHNNTGAVVNMDIFCPENFIRFEQTSFSVGARAELPFEVKLSRFMNAQMLFRKLPYMKTVIEVRTSGAKKTLPIIVGDW